MSFKESKIPVVQTSGEGQVVEVHTGGELHRAKAEASFNAAVFKRVVPEPGEADSLVLRVAGTGELVYESDPGLADESNQ